MKKALTVAALLLTLGVYGQAKKTSAVSKKPPRPKPSEVNVNIKMFVDDIRNDVGQIYTLPKQNATRYTYSVFSLNGLTNKEQSINGPSDQLDLKINSVDMDNKKVFLTDSAGKRYVASMYHMYKMFELYKRSELDTLRKMFLNKTLWLKNYRLPTEEEHDFIVDGQSLGKRRQISDDKFHYQPVRVTAVELVGQGANPYRLRLLTKDNIAGCYDFDFRMVPLETGTVNRLSEEFFGFDPIQRYHLTPAQLKIIRKGEIRMGMNETMVTLINGEPDDINYSTYGTRHEQQWVYKGYNGKTYYYYFTNGRLTAQN